MYFSKKAVISTIERQDEKTQQFVQHFEEQDDIEQADSL